MQKTRVFLSLGSNLGHRKVYLEQAVLGLDKIPHSRVIRSSSVYETTAWGKTDQGNFYNIAVELETSLEAHDLLHFTQAIEHSLGREREEFWGPRTIDIDLLLFGEEKIDTQELTIPHPFMTKRAFVLEPLQEIAGDLKLQGKGIGEMLEELGEGKANKVGELFKDW